MLLIPIEYYWKIRISYRYLEVVDGTVSIRVCSWRILFCCLRSSLSAQCRRMPQRTTGPTFLFHQVAWTPINAASCPESKLRRLLDSGCDWGSTWSFLNCWASSILTLASTWTKPLWIVPPRLNVSGWMLVGWFEWYAPRGTSFLLWVWLFLSHPNSAGLLLLSGHPRTISRGAGELFHLSRGRDAPCLCRETWGNICREPSSSAQFRTCFAQVLSSEKKQQAAYICPTWHSSSMPCQCLDALSSSYFGYFYLLFVLASMLPFAFEVMLEEGGFMAIYAMYIYLWSIYAIAAIWNLSRTPNLCVEMPGFQGDHYMSRFGPENSVQKKFYGSSPFSMIFLVYKDAIWWYPLIS